MIRRNAEAAARDPRDRASLYEEITTRIIAELEFGGPRLGGRGWATWPTRDASVGRKKRDPPAPFVNRPARSDPRRDLPASPRSGPTMHVWRIRAADSPSAGRSNNNVANRASAERANHS